jgi:2-methylisocitrate lyase-like PEP mutase family enzyme
VTISINNADVHKDERERQARQIMLTQAEKGSRFAALHERGRAFIIPNPWDAGTARLLEHLGFEALATTSAGYAFSQGRRDNTTGRDEMLGHASAVASATDLPVSADLEGGFGDSPEDVAETIRLAAGTGLCGCSIEDMSSDPKAGDREHSIYGREHATERIHAAAEVVRGLPFRFMLTARAENYLVGKRDLKDTIQRLQAYQEAGADVLYAPGLTTKEEIATVVRSVDRPVNVIMGLQGIQFTLADLSEIGVRRVSVGSALSRAALGAFLRAAREMQEHGTFSFAEQAVSYRDISAIFDVQSLNRMRKK